jgi:hypothetical protein
VYFAANENAIRQPLLLVLPNTPASMSVGWPHDGRLSLMSSIWVISCPKEEFSSSVVLIEEQLGRSQAPATLAERGLDFAETELGRTTTIPDERSASRRVGSASFRRDGLDAARQRAAHRLDEVRACRRRSVLPRANGLIRTTRRLSTATGSSGRKFARVAGALNRHFAPAPLDAEICL